MFFFGKATETWTKQKKFAKMLMYEFWVWRKSLANTESEKKNNRLIICTNKQNIRWECINNWFGCMPFTYFVSENSLANTFFFGNRIFVDSHQLRVVHIIIAYCWAADDGYNIHTHIYIFIQFKDYPKKRNPLSILNNGCALCENDR